MSSAQNWPRLQVSIATLLWLTLCVASFFGGRYWERMDKSKATAVLAKTPVTPRVTAALQVQILAGEATIIDAGMPVNRLMAADPTVAKIVPISDKSFQVRSNSVGSTKITVWDDSTGRSAVYDVSVVR